MDVTGHDQQVVNRLAPVPTVPTQACSSCYPQESVEFRSVVSDVQRQTACCSAFRCPPDGNAVLYLHSSASHSTSPKNVASIFLRLKFLFHYSSISFFYHYGLTDRFLVILSSVLLTAAGTKPRILHN